MSQWSKRTGIQLAYPYLESRMRRPEWQRFIVQPKLNGDRNRSIIGSEVQLISSEGNVRPCIPHINEALQIPELRGLELDGEVYKHGWSWAKINSVVSRTKNPHPEFKDVEYHLFDLIIDAPQHERLNLLYNVVKPLFGDTSPIKVIESTPCSTIEEAYVLLLEYMKEGYEGIVMRTWDGFYVRKRTNLMQKWKPRRQDCYPVIGLEEECDQYGEPKGMLGAIICETDGVPFKISAGGLKHDERLAWFERRDEIPGMFALTKYVELTEDNIPNHAVLVELVTEFVETDDDFIIE